MNTHRHLLWASSFTLLFATSAFAQNSATVNGSAVSSKCDSSMRCNADRTLDRLRWHTGTFTPEERDAGFTPENAPYDFPPDAMMGGAGHLARAFKFLYNDKFRSKVEAPMSAIDKQTIESTVADAKTNVESLKAIKPQMKSAWQNHDTVQFAQAIQNSVPVVEALFKDKVTIDGILAKYKIGPGANASSGGALTDPVYPNPLHLGGSPATITYHVDQTGPVNIVVTDASGNIVQQFTENADTPGAHTVTLNSNLPQAGTYYVTVTAAGQKSTQKIEAVQ